MRPESTSLLSELAARLRGRFHHRTMVLAYLVGLGLLFAATLTIVNLVDSGREAEDPDEAGKGVDMVAGLPAGAFPADGVYRLTTGGDCLGANGKRIRFGASGCAEVTVFAVQKGVYRLTGGFGAGREQCLAAAGERLKAEDCTDDARQTFATVPAGDTGYRLATAATGRCATPAGDATVLADCGTGDERQRFTLDERDSEPAVYPVTGSYTVRAGPGDLCLGEGPGPGDRDVLVQQDCSADGTGLTFQPFDGDKTRVEVDGVASNWANCLAADPPGDEPGGLLGATACGEDELQVFELEPYGGGVYRVRAAADGLCLGVGGSREPGAAVGMTDCADGRTSQLFRLELDAALPTKPTEFGAWWSDSAREWGAKWERPAVDGGQDITGYLVEDCRGTELAVTGGSTFETDMSEPADGCVTVRALTEPGPGAPARFRIEE